jgi:hypothetical protein
MSRLYHTRTPKPNSHYTGQTTIIITSTDYSHYAPLSFVWLSVCVYMRARARACAVHRLPSLLLSNQPPESGIGGVGN